MLGESWPEEPDEPFTDGAAPFPEYREPSPPRHAARIMARRAGDGSTSQRERAVQSALVGLLPVFRVGILALAVGLMLLVFRGTGLYAQSITGIGVVTCLYGVHRYVLYREALGTRRDP